MKILKYILGILAVLISVFLIIGVSKSEVAYDYEIMVDKPLAESWAVSQDESKMADWLEGFQRMEHVSGTPNAEGAVSDVYFISDGQEMVIREKIIEIVPDESVTMEFTSDFMNMDYSLHMAPVDGKTKISTKTTAVGNGILSRSLMAIMAGSFQEQEEKNLARLKKTIEENTTNYATNNSKLNETSEEE